MKTKLLRTDKLDATYEDAIMEVRRLIRREVSYDGAAKGAVVFLGAYARILSAEVHLLAIELMNEKRKGLPSSRLVASLPKAGQ